jgi:drug/metabolite transporter (DMT)-like permease
VSPLFGSRQRRWLLAARGVIGALGMTTFYLSIQLLPLADATVLFFANGPLAALLAWVLRGEPMGLGGAAGVLASFAGVVVLAHPPFMFGGHAEWGPRRAAGTSVGLLSALFAAGAFVCIRAIGKGEPALVVALWFHSAALFSAVPLALGWPERAVALSAGDAGLLLAVAAASFLGQLLITRGLQSEPAARASAVNFSQVLWSYAFGLALFNDRLTLPGAAGSLLIAAGIFIVQAFKPPPPQPSALSAAAAAAAGEEAAAAAAAAPLPGAVQLAIAPAGCGEGDALLGGGDGRGGGGDGRGGGG